MSGYENHPLIDLFRTEAESQTAILSEGLIVLEKSEATPATLEALMRAAHSLKGAARIVGIDDAVRVAHILEDYFVAAQRSQITIVPAHIDVLLRGVDLLNRIAQPGSAESQETIEAYTTELKHLLEGGGTPPTAEKKPASEPAPAPPPAEKVQPPAPPSPPPAPVPEPIRQETTSTPPQAEVKAEPAPPVPSSAITPEKTERVVRVTADSLSRLMGLAGESLVEARQFAPFVGSLRELKQTQSALWDSLRKLEDSWSKKQGTNGDTSVGLLVQAKDLAAHCQQVLNRKLEELENFAHRSEDLSGRLHHEVIISRMRPLSDGIRGFPRMVRDLARQLGKQVDFEIRGENTGVDRDVLEKLEAPLNHLIRNALDHGIELPEDRIKAGKAPNGSLRLEAHHRAGMLQIMLRDDGRGIDPARLRNKIVERGLANAGMAQRLSEAELFEFLFLPGFSTKEAVTEISGRGVGLDVVQSMVRTLGGSVRVGSIPGRETSFTLRLPISMSVIRALLVQIAGEAYAFPLTRIDRIELLVPEQIEWLEGRQFFSLDQHTVGLVEAGPVLELPDEPVAGRREMPVVVIGDRGHRFGLVVEKFLGERDLDVRPLDPRLGKVPNVGSASVLEDGSPVLIFDVEDLVRSIDNLLTGRRLKRPAFVVPSQAAAVKRILVVDDSITVRELERQLLANHGYEVDTAVDGMDGWNAVRSGNYDLVVSDVDMPRMDGIDLVRRIKADAQLKMLPVIIVSYKDRQEDRLRGLDAGATCYLTKSSFHDQTFLEAVTDLIGEATQ